jgi:hypothetical protein
MIDLLQNQVELSHLPSVESPRNLTVGAESAFVFQSVAEACKTLKSGFTTEHRVAAVWCLALSDEEFATATLVAALFDGEEEVRRAAAQALSQSRDPEIPTASIENLFPPENDGNSWKVAVADLKSPDAETRASALSTIGNLKRENAFHLITDCFDDECAGVGAPPSRSGTSDRAIYRCAEGSLPGSTLKDSRSDSNISFGEATDRRPNPQEPGASSRGPVAVVPHGPDERSSPLN